ncbi:MAG: SpoIIE family protein phosphatase [Cellvibrionaceae bacterium]
MQNSDYTLLVIDDDVGVRQSFVAYLQDSDFQVYDTPDAKKGLALFEQFVPDLVITDLKMPGMDGLNLLKSLHQKYPELPVIVISGAGVMSDVVDALRLGATDYLIKPVVDMEVLIHAVRRSLERSHLLVENQRYRTELESVNERLRSHIESLEQDQQAGHFVQQSMQPVSPFSARDYTCAHKLMPSLFLSGDCIDYALLEKRYYAFYLADVSGHGSAPAFVTIWLKNLVSQLVRMRKLLSDFDAMHSTLHELVTVINDEMIEIHLNNHMTMIVGIIDTVTHELFYIVAGHLPLPILVGPEGTSYLEGKGKPVGLFDDNQWQVNHTRLPDKCSLVLFSDGILEVVEGNNLLEKEESLLQLLSETNGSVDEVCRRITHLDIANAPDDIALLSISRGV